MELEKEDYENAGRLCSELLEEIGAMGGSSVVDIIQNAFELDPYGIEVNGCSFSGIDDDGNVIVNDSNGDRTIYLDEIEWIRVEGYYGKGNYSGAVIMYVYLNLNESKTGIDFNNIQFDYYPDPDTDDYVELEYNDCK